MAKVNINNIYNAKFKNTQLLNIIKTRLAKSKVTIIIITIIKIYNDKNQ